MAGFGGISAVCLMVGRFGWRGLVVWLPGLDVVFGPAWFGVVLACLPGSGDRVEYPVSGLTMLQSEVE